MAVAVMVLGIFFLLPKPEQIYADDKENVSNIEELNAVLGGNHKIDGDTLILQSDVEVRTTISIKDYESDRLVIDMNGKNITYIAADLTNWYAPLFDLSPWADRSTGTGGDDGSYSVTFTGKGTIKARNSIFQVNDRNLQLILEGNISYTSIGHGKPVIETDGVLKKLTIQGGSFYRDDSYFKIDFVIDMGLWGEGEEPAVTSAEEVSVEGGKFYGNIRLMGKHVSVSGGTVLGNLDLAGTGKTVISGGTIKQSTCLQEPFKQNLEITGTAKLNGLVVYSPNANITISGGTIRSFETKTAITMKPYSDDEVFEKRGVLTITGGTVWTPDSSGFAIVVNDSDDSAGYDIYIKGGNLIDTTKKTGKSGKAAIYLGKKDTCTFKPAKNATATIKNFKYAVYAEKDGAIKIGKNVVVQTSSNRKYAKKSKIPKKLTGDLKIYVKTP
jgi:hypothetical protein